MGEIATRLSDFTIITSDNPRTEVPSAIIDDILQGIYENSPHAVIENRKDAIFYALDNALPKDVIILAGKGHETYQEINHVKHHFDEREVVAEYFAKKRKPKDGEAR
jgi:UDP-N-acetylmuramoyl-L-alanyl-D-glutamate--2,6-diaminopimelate ligase